MLMIKMHPLEVLLTICNCWFKSAVATEFLDVNKDLLSRIIANYVAKQNESLMKNVKVN